ncbi:ATP-dependent helicase, C-terminal [Dillenia turbinata]|uniref:ATP-dependent helicase, C-terminal n=1 Tax=Dillenia turbinata TaxID=194707 RepID=A0AAN8UDM4_9MAGN
MKNPEMDRCDTKFSAFPYKPYSIQVDFMNALYQFLDNGGVSMLESPTAQSGSDDEPDWLKNFAIPKDDQKQDNNNMKKNKKKNKPQLGFDKPPQRSYLDKEEDLNKIPHENLKSNKENIELNDEEFLMDEYESEDEEGNGRTLKRKVGGPHVSVCSSSDEDGEDKEESDEDVEEEATLKVYFCSRTHSQLSQFVRELRKTAFASELKVVSLGSRKNFCINEDVLKLGSSTRINERCLELQNLKKSKISKIKNLGAGGRLRRTKASSGCPMLRKHQLQKEFRNEISQQGPMDIEDLVKLGRRIGTCPYYGSRSEVPAAELVVLPYQSILSRATRESLGLNLKDNIVIIDEAHNLADSLISMYDSKITLPQLEQVLANIQYYHQRFQSLLGPGNRRYIQILLVLTRAFLKTLLDKKDLGYEDSWVDADKASEMRSSLTRSMAINDFLFSLNIDNINLVKLLKYIRESNIIHKLCGYVDRVAELKKETTAACGESHEEGSSLSSFHVLVDFLISLTNKDGDGRIIISRRPQGLAQEGPYLKYVMLTGEKIFSEIVDQAHAVILAGGTLQPVEETRERLFPWLTLDKFHFFSCGHIVPPDSILPVAVSCGPSGQSFDFSYSSRSSSNMIQEVGLLLSNLVTVVPEGVVVFFSSFEYEGQVHDSWKTSGILDRIMKKKHLFREPRSSTEVGMVLKKYKETIERLSAKGPDKDLATQNGAILLAVVGGKISEGINLSDGLGRCIVMVGLPYPSPFDIELMERVKYIESLGDANTSKTSKFVVDSTAPGRNIPQVGFDILRSCTHRGKDYYENLCMKAVNQSIGRAIRHINDYAAILLVDSRYASDPTKRSFSHPTNKLPQWIKDRLVPTTDNYGQPVEAQMSYCLCLRQGNHNGYQKLPKATQFNPLSCGNINPKIQQLDQLQTDFSDHLESGEVTFKKSHNNRTMTSSSQSQRSQQDMPSGSSTKKSPTKNNQNGGGREVKKMGSFQESKRGFVCPPSENGGAYLLSQKMKELEMMDVGNMDHVLDVEEALHYYSRLTCPVYLDIVDKFFLDMYSEFFISPPSLRINSSSRRLGPVKF